MKPTPITHFKKSVYSQAGEDGLIEEILNRLSVTIALDKWCVEFGALDGVTFSNTCNLIKNHNYCAVLIEGDPQKYKQLCKNLPQERVLKICEFISLDARKSLETTLKSTPIPTTFDFLSIDIDGCDYHIFENLKYYAPKIVCIEFNHHIPNEVEFIQPANFTVKQGSSAKSLIKLAATKNYFLAAITNCNLIFVHNSYSTIIHAVRLEEVRDDEACKNFVFFGYDGTLLSNKESLRVPWHRISVSTKKIQVLPRYLRRFGEDYSIFQKCIFGIFVLLRHPKDFIELYREKVLKQNVKHHNQKD